MVSKEDKSFLKKVVPAAAFIAGLCCFSPVVIVLLGLGTTAFAASLADTLYGTYKWVFRSAGLLFVLAALFYYFYFKQKVCSIDQAWKQRRKILNLTLITLFIAIAAYFFWLYVVVEYIGIFLGIWG